VRVKAMVLLVAALVLVAGFIFLRLAAALY
jgi:hypothetical protein